METYEEFRKHNEEQLKKDFVAEHKLEYESYCQDVYLTLLNTEDNKPKNFRVDIEEYDRRYYD